VRFVLSSTKSNADYLIMSFVPLEGEDASWVQSPKEPGDIVKDAIRKEQTIREIMSAQEDLRALLARVKAVQADVDKLTSGNETLQMYVDNLRLQVVKQR